jgi:hypothetical protein
MEGCKNVKGMCKHEKGMMAMIIVAVLAFLGWKFI